MLERIRSTIKKFNMIQKGDRILVGVSGGPDSITLVHVLSKLSRELEFEIYIAHLDHGFRGQESANDAMYVSQIADSMGIQAVIEYRDVPRYALDKKMSGQTAARELRYCFFQEAAETLKCNKLATGHNANDQAETVLFNFLRGSGSAGLGGIPPVRDGWVIRPLIETTRADVETYCETHNLKTRLDKSNLKEVYTRNKIRLNLLPMLQKEYNQNLVETLVRTSEILREEEAFLETLALQESHSLFMYESSSRIELNLGGLYKLPRVLLARIIRMAWQKLTCSVHTLEFVHLDNIIRAVQDGQTGALLHLPGGVFFQKSYNKCILTIEHAADEPEYTYLMKVPGVTAVPEIEAEITTEFVETKDLSKKGDGEIFIDFDAVLQPLTVRNRMPGDRFSPIGMEGTKKVKKYLIDNKIPWELRGQIPVIVSGDNQIIWLGGLREDRRWQVTEKTRNILKIKLSGCPC